MTRKLAILILVFLVVGCGSSRESARFAANPHSENSILSTDHRQTDTAELHEDTSEDTFEEDLPPICDEVPVPVSLILENIATTDFSALVRVEAVDVVGANNGPPNTVGYNNHRYRVSVDETISGLPEHRITFYVMADADIQPLAAVGDQLFVSLCCTTSKVVCHSPDNGYVFPAPPSFVQGLNRALEKGQPAAGASVCLPEEDQ